MEDAPKQKARIVAGFKPELVLAAAAAAAESSSCSGLSCNKNQDDVSPSLTEEMLSSDRLAPGYRKKKS